MISHSVWLSDRFSLRDRDVEAMLVARGIVVTSEAMRPWGRTCGQDDANQRRHWRPKPGDQWYVDEVWLTIHGERHDRWRAVDPDDNVLALLVQSRRNTRAAKPFFRTLLKGVPYVPRVIITEKRTSDGAATRESVPGVEHGQSRSLNNRCEHSPCCTRQRAYRMQGCKAGGMRSACSPRMVLLRNTSAPDGIGCPRRHTTQQCGTASRVGRQSRGADGRPQRRVGGHRVRHVPAVAWGHDHPQPLDNAS